jgi:hypothetical protein
MRIIAFIANGPTVRDILGYLGEPATPPRVAPSGGPPLWDPPATGAGGAIPTPSRHPSTSSINASLGNPDRCPRARPGRRVPSAAGARRELPDAREILAPGTLRASQRPLITLAFRPSGQVETCFAAPEDATGALDLLSIVFRDAVAAGRRPHFGCFNRLLADQLTQVTPKGGEVATYHQLWVRFLRAFERWNSVFWPIGRIE